MNRHNTLPAGMGSRQTSVEGGRSSSTAPSSSKRADSSSRTSSQHSSRLGQSSADKTDQRADLTNSVTVSSLTSYVTENSAPLVQDVSKLSQPSSPYHQNLQQQSQAQAQAQVTAPPAIVAPSAFRPIETFPPRPGPGTYTPDISVTMVPQQGVMLPQRAGTAPGLMGAVGGALATTSSSPHYRPSHLISPSMSPVMSGYQTHPPPSHISRACSTSGPGMLSTGGVSQPGGSQSMYQVGAVSPQHVTGGSVSSLTRGDPSHDILLQEITRLRSRLQTLETENASMSYKLNQQQWEVEHRLSEIEMHICGSDSVDSEEKSSLQGNKESII